jgi:hypothetical protein
MRKRASYTVFAFVIGLNMAIGLVKFGSVLSLLELWAPTWLVASIIVSTVLDYKERGKSIGRSRKGNFIFTGIVNWGSRLMSDETRERVYEPAYHDLLSNYLTALNCARLNSGAIRWLTLRFRLHAVGLFLASCVIGWSNRVARIVKALIPRL